MRFISVGEVTQVVKELCISANKELPCDLRERIEQSVQTESAPVAKRVMQDLCANMDAAIELDVPICQDTGMAVVFVRMGQEVCFVDGDLRQAIDEGVAQGYLQGKLRCSVVGDPLRRVNTNNNTPAIIHFDVVAGAQVEITVAPKGFGSENMSTIKMFTPSASKQDIKDYVIDTVIKAGSNPCPPMVIGVGIGGDFELCALLAKRALCRTVSQTNQDPFYQQMEEELLEEINLLGIGPQGFGGKTTALAVNIETFPTHIAGLPAAVNIGCHVTRHKTAVI